MKMNKTEQKAYIWLQAQGYKEINFSGYRSPDFILPTGEGFEVKKARNNTINFSEGQYQALAEVADRITVLVFDDPPVPIALIPFKEITSKPKFWKNIRILTSIMSKVRTSVTGTMLTVNDVANKLGVHPITVYRWIRRGKLEALKIDGILRIEEEAYNKFIGKTNETD